MIDKHGTWCINASSRARTPAHVNALKERNLKARNPSWKTMRVFSLSKHTIHKSGIYTKLEIQLYHVYTSASVYTKFIP
jgi:hypothetical protein